MNILSKVTWKALTKNKTRTGVTILAVVLATAMLTAVLTLGGSIRDYLVRDTVYRTGDYYTMFYYATDEQKQELLRNETISSVADYQALGFFMPEGTPSNWSSFLLAAGDETFFETMPVHLVEGRLPETSSELVIPDGRQDALEYFGYPTAVGSEITLELSTIYDDSQGLGTYQSAIADFPIPQRTFEKTYTIVGVVRENPFGQDGGEISPNLSTLLTFADGNQGTPIWHQLYVKTHRIRDVLPGTAYGLYAVSNRSLLALYGMDPHGQNFTLWIGAACTALIAIILVASACPIRTAFSISVSERTKEFGLLSSIGATKKQIRKSVLFEALFVCAAGIPLGLLLGFGIIATAIRGLERYIANLFLHTAGHAAIYAIASPIAFLVAVAVSAGMVFLSAWVPAKRAAKVTPIAAIRQEDDYRVRPKDVKKFSWKLWGFPGAMARKYYRVSRNKYRATVLSLAISTALFLAAATLSTQLHSAISNAIPTENFDMVFRGTPEDMEDIRTLSSVSRCAYRDSWIYYPLWDADSLSPEFLEAKTTIQNHFPQGYYTPDDSFLCIQYLEDAVLREYLTQEGIDPAPYFDEANPAALVCESVYTTPYYQVGDEWIHDVFRIYPVSENGEPPFLLSNQEYGALEQALPTEDGLGYWDSEFLLDGSTPLVKVWPVMEAPGEESGTISLLPKEEQALYFELVKDTGAPPVVRFYSYDPDAKTRAEAPTATAGISTPRFHFGQRINRLPYGIEQPGSMINLILPLSKAPKMEANMPCLTLNTSNHRATKAYLDALPDGSYTDYIAEEESSRSMVLLIDAFSYGFLALISLICAAGTFNTVSTNITLRRRDFGTLLSLGMKKKELRQMVARECVQYGLRALLWGVPTGLAAGFGISLAMGAAILPIPWLGLAVVTLATFLIVFISMLYSLFKLHGQSPMESIRQENL